MAASMWRMNGLCRNTAGVLLLCVLLFSGKVMCQDDATDAPNVPDVTDAPGAADASDAPDAAAPTSEPAAAPTDGPADVGQAAGATDPSVDKLTTVDLSQAGVSAEITAAPAAAAVDDETQPAKAREVLSVVKHVIPEVKCVRKEEIPESGAVRAVVNTHDCEESKLIILENPAAWCQLDTCKLDIFQDVNTMLVASNDAKPDTLAEALQSEHLKEQLGVKDIETPSSSGSSVLVGILITGLLAAVAIVIGYFKCQRRPETKGAKLAEEDVENQGNTLASVAPLNPPPETQEKPSVNGESPEAGKTQTPPPTNGHSTAKTADTEL